MYKKNVAEVIPLKINLNKGFHYLIPSRMKAIADIGKRVTVSFRNKKIVGVIVKIIAETKIKNLKEIEEVIDPFPLLSPEVFSLIDWISKYYLCPKGTIITNIIPSQVSRKKINKFLDNNQEKGNISESLDITARVNNNCSKNNNQQFLLFGNKSSKSTNDFYKPILFHYHSYKIRDRYYDKCIEEIVQKGKQALILIPDQWSCAQLKKKMLQRYGNEVGIFDKKVNQTQKYLRFLRVEMGDIKVVIGTRSNVFLPFRNLGLIIVEQENSILFKEERVPRYNAREVALTRGKLGSFQVIMGSSAPSIESYWHAMNRRYTLKTEKLLVNSYKKFPEIQIVNMEDEKSFQRIISFRLQQQIVHCLKEGDKIILFLNRRGFAGYMVCSQCGYVVKCPNCNHLLSYHVEGDSKWVVCHVCGKKIKMEKYCPKCGKGEIKPLGAGTQHVETLIRRMFPKAVIQRLDIDIAPRLNTQRRIINEFNQGKIDILIGTQLLFRELNYQHVGVVGLILVDHLLNVPDYKSAELSFQFIYQLALNFAERKELKKLIIQTYQFEHHGLQAIKKLNYKLFYQQETMIRGELDYPPFTKIIKIEFVGKKRENVKKSAIDFIDYIQSSGLVSKYELDFHLNKDNIIIVREKDKNRSSCMLKINTQKQDIDYFKKSLFQYISKYQSHDVKLVVDIDPMKMY